MLKILQARLKQHLNWELPDVQEGLEKAKEPEIKSPTFTESQRKQKNSKENIYYCLIDYVKAFDCMDHNKLENSKRDENTNPSYLSPEKPVLESRSNS